MDYYEAKYALPFCNHTEGLSFRNIGYTVGITEDGVPFEAELFRDDDEISISVLIPAIFDSNPVEEIEGSKILYFRDEASFHDNSVLDLGMVDEGEEDELCVVQRNVDFLVDRGIIAFASDFWNGNVQYRVDVLGNDLNKIVVTLEDKDGVWAFTDLSFRDFIRGNSRQNHKVVDLGSWKDSKSKV